jgi:hypothetical protein
VRAQTPEAQSFLTQRGFALKGLRERPPAPQPVGHVDREPLLAKRGIALVVAPDEPTQNVPPTGLQQSSNPSASTASITSSSVIRPEWREDVTPVERRTEARQGVR